MSAALPGGRIEPAEERRRLLAAFVELVVERGFAAVDRGAVSERAGLGRRAFERHFPDQLACFQAAWDWLETEYMSRLYSVLEPGSSWREHLRAGAGETVRLVTAHPRQARFLAIESLVAGEPGRERQRALGARVAGLIDACRARIDDQGATPASTSSWVVGIFFDRIYRCLAGGTEAELRDQLPELLFLAVSAYSGTEAGLAELRIPPP